MHKINLRGFGPSLLLCPEHKAIRLIAFDSRCPAQDRRSAPAARLRLQARS